MKKLVGRTDLEDALKRLDKLTHEEARMAAAQVLKATHSVEERVRGVADTLLGVDDRVTRVEDGVTGVDDRVAGVDERVNDIDDRLASVGNKVATVDDRVACVDSNRVEGVNNKVDSIDERVKTIDDKVDEVAEGTQAVSSRTPRVYLTLIHLGTKRGRTVTQQTANDVDQVKSPSTPTIIHAVCAALPFLQGIKFGRTFTHGYPHRIRLRTITLHVVLITKPW
jgi:methyl-accepting chemotaxis protein